MPVGRRGALLQHLDAGDFEARLPGGPGATRRAMACLLILTASDDEADRFAAIKAGASGYLLKDFPAEQIIASVRLAHTGRAMIPPHMASQLVAKFSRLSKEPTNDEAVDPHLTGRELEVLALVARGQANKKISTQLSFSENTLSNHMRKILRKLQLRGSRRLRDASQPH